MPGADLDVIARLAQARYRLRGSIVENALAQLAYATKANFDPNQPRVPRGNPAGGQWTRVVGTGESQSKPTDDSTRVAGDISGFTRHGINQAITRGVSPSAIRDAVVNPIQIIPQGNGTTRYLGAGAVVVLDPAGRVITVWGQ